MKGQNKKCDKVRLSEVCAKKTFQWCHVHDSHREALGEVRVAPGKTFWLPTLPRIGSVFLLRAAVGVGLEFLVLCCAEASVHFLVNFLLHFYWTFFHTSLQILDYIFAKLTNYKILFLVNVSSEIRGYLMLVFHLLSGKRTLRKIWQMVDWLLCGAPCVRVVLEPQIGNRQEGSQKDWGSRLTLQGSKLWIVCYLLIFQTIVNKYLLSLKCMKTTTKQILKLKRQYPKTVVI